ncbi:unnamed protein product [Prunus brigantina]
MSSPKTRVKGSSSSRSAQTRSPAYLTRDGVDQHAIENLSRSYPSSEVRNSAVKWSDWIDRLLSRYGDHWKRAGIYDSIFLSKQSVNIDENLLAAALCFWNSASNMFNFRVGPMSPILLDMAPIFGFWPHGRPIRFPNYSSVVLLEYMHLAEALHNHTDVGLGPTVLAHL